MALSRSTVLLLLLPCPAVAYLAASLGDVSASSQCLSSPEAVRQEYPGSWASWTTHAPNHKGTKCWFPAMRENHSRHVETLLRNSAEVQAKVAQAKGAQTKEAQTKEAQSKEVETNNNRSEQRQQIERAAKNKLSGDPALVPAREMNELGWSFRSRTAKVGPVRIFDEFAQVESSFNDRFAPALEVTSVSQPSIIQRMMDPVGAIP
jgi:hypothetical protein